MVVFKFDYLNYLVYFYGTGTLLRFFLFLKKNFSVVFRYFHLVSQSTVPYGIVQLG